MVNGSSPKTVKPTLERSSDRKLLIIATVLLCFEFLWLLAHLRILPTPFYDKKTAAKHAEAGYVVAVNNDLKKREMDSLIWEETEKNDVLRYYDSVLTLKQSSATLYLKEQTEVHLSENTLVTIEPMDDTSANQIRLKFNKGDLRARNPKLNTIIEAPTFTLNLTEGSEVQLRQTDDKKYEVEVLKGDLKVQKDGKEEDLKENQVIRVTEESKELQTFDVSSDLKLSDELPKRVYTFDDMASLPVKWQGQADKLVVTSANGEQTSYAVQGNLQDLKLPPGKYSVRLESKKSLSQSLDLEVWQAPTIFLLNPNPRNRIRIGEEVSFVWSPSEKIASYRFELVDFNGKVVRSEKSDENGVDIELENPGSFLWRVIGIDKDGVEIRSQNSQEVFAAPKLLAAPKLKDPHMRVPASNEKQPEQHDEQPPEKKKSSPKKRDSTFWWMRLLLNQAHAQNKPAASYEAVFEWEKVPGASHYVIEISEKPDFQKLALSKKVKTTQFIWAKFPLGVYYWRVAAGNSSELGEFSQGAVVNLAEMPEKSSMQSGVIIRKTEPVRADVKTDDATLLQPLPTKPIEDEQRYSTEPTSRKLREIENSYLLEVGPEILNYNLQADKELKANLAGTFSSGIHLQTEQKVSDERSYVFDVTYLATKWKAKSKDELPFQNDVTLAHWQAQLLLGNQKDTVFYGAAVETFPMVARDGLEEAKINTIIGVGPAVYYLWGQAERLRGGNQLAVYTGSKIFSVSTRHEVRYLFFDHPGFKFSLGLRVQATGIFYNQQSSSGYSGAVTLGWED